MRSRFSRRNRLIGHALESEGRVARNQTILGTGEVPFFTDLDITISGTPITGGGAGGTIPSIYPPPGPGLPPAGPPPDAVSALPVQRPAPFWVNVNGPAAAQEFVYRHNYNFPARLLQCYFRLQTGIVVGTRNAKVSLRDDSGNRVAGAYANVAQAASIIRDWQFCHNWSLGSGTHSWAGALGFILCWLPQVSIMPNWTFQSEFNSGGAGTGLLGADLISNIKLLMIKEPLY